MKLAVLTLLMAALLDGCSNGGSTLPGGYHCTAPQNPYGCYTSIAFTHGHVNPDNNPDIPGDPVGARSDLYMVPLTCDAACQASSGGGNPPGAIANFIQLYQQAGWFMRIGYETTPSGLQYFLEYQIPTTNYGQFTHENLGSLSVSASPSEWRYATMYIGVVTDDSASISDWVAYIVPSGASPILYIITYVGLTTFHPDEVFYGQSIYGTSGATAQLSFFANNNIFTSPWSLGHTSETLAEDGSPPGVISTVDHPTDAGWFIKASMSSNGGMFRVACC